MFIRIQVMLLYYTYFQQIQRFSKLSGSGGAGNSATVPNLVGGNGYQGIVIIRYSMQY